MTQFLLYPTLTPRSCIKYLSIRYLFGDLCRSFGQFLGGHDCFRGRDGRNSHQIFPGFVVSLGRHNLFGDGTGQTASLFAGLLGLLEGYGLGGFAGSLLLFLLLLLCAALGEFFF